VVHLEKWGGATRAQVDAFKTDGIFERARQEAIEQVENERAYKHKPMAKMIEGILMTEFTNPANEQARRNRIQSALGFAAIVLPAAAGYGLREFVEHIHHFANGPIKPAHPAHPGAPAKHPPISSHPGSHKPSAPTTTTTRHIPGSPKAPPTSTHHPNQIYVNPKSINNGYVTNAYERALGGQRRGFLAYLQAEHRAIHEHLLQRVQPDPSNRNLFWDKLTEKGAKMFAKGKAGSSATKAVMSILSHTGSVTIIR
jgi:hypothetical protein